MDSHGWVAIYELLAATGATQEQLDTIVRENNKKRFEYDVTGTKIRACQGHTVDVNIDLEPQEPPTLLYHGTCPTVFAEHIQKTGLLPMSRKHVHLSEDVETARNVGLRKSKTPIILHIAAHAMHEDGYTFWKSTNGVWLANAIPPQYIVYQNPI